MTSVPTSPFSFYLSFTLAILCLKRFTFESRFTSPRRWRWYDLPKHSLSEAKTTWHNIADLTLTGSFTPWEPQVPNRLRVSDKTVLRKILGSKRNELTGSWINLHMRGFITCILHKILLRWSNQYQERWDGQNAITYGRYNKCAKNVSRKNLRNYSLSPARRREEKIKIYPEELRPRGGGGLHWVRFAQGRDRWRSVSV
jgi:hypothetical protein